MRLIGLLAVIPFIVVVPLTGETQQAERVYRVGVLGEKSSDPSEARLWQVFQSSLRERGWIEGKNVAIESRWAGGNSGRIRELAAELVRLKVDVIVTRGSIYTEGARAATSSIPVVFTIHADPENTGHVASLARPGGNITGLSILMTDLNVKGLEFLNSTVPGARRIAVLGSPDMPSYAPSLKALEEAARRLQLHLRTVVARSGSDLDTAFSAMARDHAQAVLVLGFGPYMAARQRIGELAVKHRLPTFFPWREHVEAGGLMSYGPDISDLFRRAAAYVDKILKGAKPADIPVEQPTKFDFVLNLKTAKALGIDVPTSLLLRADEVIE
jgi:putative tryptophan/tyrosine transport system substrate-binding protein